MVRHGACCTLWHRNNFEVDCTEFDRYTASPNSNLTQFLCHPKFARGSEIEHGGTQEVVNPPPAEGPPQGAAELV
jgi:hypothetical protein